MQAEAGGAERARRRRATRRATARHARGGASRRAAAPCDGRRARLDARLAVGGHAPAQTRRALPARGGRGHGDRVLVGARATSAATAARRSGARARRRRAPSRRGARVEREVAQRLGQRGRVAARDEHAVDAVAHDVAVAGDVGGDDRRAGGERLREDHAEALAAQRRRAEHVGAAQRLAASRRRTPCPARSTPRASSSSGSTSSVPAPTSVSSAGTCSRSASKARSRTGRPLRSTAWPTKSDPQRAVAVRDVRRAGGSAGTSTPLGMIAVAAAVEAPAGPGRGLGDGDARRAGG